MVTAALNYRSASVPLMSRYPLRLMIELLHLIERCFMCCQDVHSQGEVISCLEKELVKQAEQRDRAHQIKEECQRAILRVAELSSDDFHLDRHLYFSCRDDRERFCQNVRMIIQF